MKFIPAICSLASILNYLRVQCAAQFVFKTKNHGFRLYLAKRMDNQHDYLHHQNQSGEQTSANLLFTQTLSTNGVLMPTTGNRTWWFNQARVLQLPTTFTFGVCKKTDSGRPATPRLTAQRHMLLALERETAPHRDNRRFSCAICMRTILLLANIVNRNRSTHLVKSVISYNGVS